LRPSLFPIWDRAKLLAKLKREAPKTGWAGGHRRLGEILKQAGLITAVKRQRRPLDQQQRPFAGVAGSQLTNGATDFKGWFRTADRRRVDPLTITDNCSRFLIDIRIVPPTIEGVLPVFTAAFSQPWACPLAIRCDNGSPFGSRGAGGLTRLSAWWVKLGVEPHFIRPASPQEKRSA